MISPITNKEMMSEEMILMYGVPNEEMSILKFLFGNLYDITDITLY